MLLRSTRVTREWNFLSLSCPSSDYWLVLISFLSLPPGGIDFHHPPYFFALSLPLSPTELISILPPYFALTLSSLNYLSPSTHVFSLCSHRFPTFYYEILTSPTCVGTASDCDRKLLVYSLSTPYYILNFPLDASTEGLIPFYFKETWRTYTLLFSSLVDTVFNFELTNFLSLTCPWFIFVFSEI